MKPAELAPRLLVKAGLRFYSRHPSQLALTLAGIALGVAAIVAIDVAAFSSRQAFESSVRLLRGPATHELTAPGGDLPEAVLAELRTAFGQPASAPVLEGRIWLDYGPRRATALIGIDPLSAARLGASPLSGGPGGSDFRRLLLEPWTAYVSAGLARDLDVAAGARLGIVDPPTASAIRVLGVLPGTGDQRYLLADVATAQEVLQRVGRLSRIDLRLDDATARQLGEAMERRGLLLRPVATVLGQVDSMTRAFRINLQALSLLAMLVGAFLVFSTVAFSVTRRHEVFGLFRSLGVDRLQVFGLVLSETLVLAAAGTVIGLFCGVALGAGLVRLMLRTIGDLYLLASVDYFGVSPQLLVKAVAIGFAASLVAAFVPAVDATRVTPRQAMLRSVLEAGQRRALRPQAVLSLLLGAAGAAILLRVHELRLAFVGIFLVLIATALLAPVVLQVTMRVLAAVSRWLPLAYAARSVAANLSRTGPAVAALMLAVATVAGVGLMIDSFRGSVERWLDYSLDADLLLRPDDPRALNDAQAEAELLADLRAIPGVLDISLSRRTRLPDAEGLGSLLAIRPASSGRWPQTTASRGPLLQRLAARDLVIVSESFARKRGLVPGDRLRLFTPRGVREFGVDAVFTDYSSDLGLVAMDLDRYRAIFGDRAIDSIGLFIAPDHVPEVLQQVEQQAASRGDFRVVTSAWLRGLTLDIFDRTFTITEVLRLIAALVAVIAVVNALQAQRLDSRREMATLRALGLAPAQLLRLGELQSVLLGLVAGMLAVPVGILMAWLLIVVVNRIAFGWSIDFDVSPGILLQCMLLAAAAAWLAGWLSGRDAFRETPAAALREA